MRYSTVLLVVVSISLPACSSPDDDIRNTTVLLGSDQSAADTINAVLVGLQRDLIYGVASADTAMLSHLISGDFISHDVRVREAIPISPDGGNRPQQLTYLEVLAGRLSKHLAADYGNVQVVPSVESATVYAFRADHAIQTQWRYRSAQWQAFRMIIMRPEDARAMLNLAQD
jgi:hypothetical protein